MLCLHPMRGGRACPERHISPPASTDDRALNLSASNHISTSGRESYSLRCFQEVVNSIMVRADVAVALAAGRFYIDDIVRHGGERLCGQWPREALDSEVGGPFRGFYAYWFPSGFPWGGFRGNECVSRRGRSRSKNRQSRVAVRSIPTAFGVAQKTDHAFGAGRRQYRQAELSRAAYGSIGDIRRIHEREELSALSSLFT